MAAGTDTGLSEEQIEQLTDLMVSKLSMIAVQARSDPDSVHWLSKDERPINRDEVRLVILDTSILMASENPAELLERWLASE